MLIGNKVGVLVGVTVGLALAVGSGVLLGDGVTLGLCVTLGTMVVAIADAFGASLVTFPPFALHPPVINIRSNPKDNPRTTLIVFWCLPINKCILDSFGCVSLL
jgi:hypothetical protein